MATDWHMSFKKYFLYTKRFSFKACAYLYLWAVFVNVIGYALIGYVVAPRACLPYLSTFSVFLVDCDSEFLEAIWTFVLGIPRLLAVPLHLSVMRFYYGAHLAEAAWWLLLSLPFLIIAAVGYRYWWRQSPFFARAITLALAIAILYDGLTP